MDAEYDLDRWDMLRVERRLAEDLFKASETPRLSDARLPEASRPPQTGLQFPDSVSEAQRAKAEWRAVQNAYDKAFERWVAFVKHGTIPDDL